MAAHCTRGGVAIYDRFIVRHLALIAVLACGKSTAPKQVDAFFPDAPPGVDPEIPPTTSPSDLATWLDGGYYKEWTCEPAPHPEQSISNHGYNRTCNNAILHAVAGDSSQTLPLHSASVKELYMDDGVTLDGMAVSLKIGTNGADGWFWYQAGGMPPKNEFGTGSTAVGDCINCHAMAFRDFTFVILM
jgi:hypothetical protein